MLVQLLALAGAAAVLGAKSSQTFWWIYPGFDAESEDIRQLPCKADCTIDELETACAADATCVAFNTHGWLKKSIADMARSWECCRLRLAAPFSARSPRARAHTHPSPTRAERS